MFKWLSILIVVAITAITGFQVFWLMENYSKEKKNLNLRTDFAFAETIRNLQAKKLKLDNFINDSSGNVRIEMFDEPIRHAIPGEEFAGLINDVTIRINDSLRKSKNKEWIEKVDIQGSIDNDSMRSMMAKKGVTIAFNKARELKGDSINKLRFVRKGGPGEIIRLLYSVDSLQDSLRVNEIDSAYKNRLKKDDIDIEFSILRSDSSSPFPMSNPEKRPLNKITIGFAHPVTYELRIDNSFNYLFAKLASPILFSLFLVGVTVLAFTLLYRNLQRQRKLTELKNEFISNITHELKTPIATVGVAIEALRNFNAINDPQRTKEYLDISQNELQRLSLLVDKVLKLSMFEKKEIELKYEPLDLKDVVNEVVSSMRLQMEKYHATVSVNVEGDTSLQSDRLHLLSVVFNLLDNALKYGNGNIAVKFDVKEKQDKVELSVADNGIGISQEYKDKVFEKFFRVPLGNTHNTKGHGLGLSYAAHVIRKHKGNIELESQPGIGSKFIITLPKTA